MEGEMMSLIKIWVTAILSGCYCYFLSTSTKKSLIRLLLVLPIAFFFASSPYSLFSIHLIGTTWFFLTWLGISKLILFVFNQGPLSSSSSLSLPHFLCTLLLPIKINKLHSGPGPSLTGPSKWALFGVKLVAFGCVIQGYNYRDGMSFWGLLLLYCCHLYLALDILLFLTGAIARRSLGLELAPQADEPYISSSLQDFWGRRWNLMVSDILRQTVYNPIRKIASPIIGKKSAILVGIFVSFVVSGLMHEWIFSLFTHVAPTWEVTWFFVLHGTCLVVEVMIKMAVSDKWRLHRVVSGMLTMGFVAITGIWLFFPPMVRNKVHEKVVDEYAIFGRFVKSNVLYLFGK